MVRSSRRVLNASFSQFAPQLANEEGGFVDDPNDPGGATNKGITFSTFKSYPTDYTGDGTITVDDLKLLTTTGANTIYYNQYWLPLYGDKITDQSFAELFIDHAINAGKYNAVKMLQHILNTYYNAALTEDGAMGSKTYAALEKALQSSPQQLYNYYWDLRKNYYQYRADVTMSTPSWESFLSTLITPNASQQKWIDGWLNRLNRFSWSGITTAVATAVTSTTGIITITIGIGLLTLYILKRNGKI